MNTAQFRPTAWQEWRDRIWDGMAERFGYPGLAPLIQFDRGFVLMCQELQPNSGDQIGPGVYIVNYYQVMAKHGQNVTVQEIAQYLSFDFGWCELWRGDSGAVPVG